MLMQTKHLHINVVQQDLFSWEHMSAMEKLYALAHEVGHILCGHLKDWNIDYSVEVEYETNEFAHVILRSSLRAKILWWFEENSKIAIIATAIVLTVCIGQIGIFHTARQQSYYGEYYITELGSKYHEKDCIFVKDKANVYRLTEEQYYSGEYEPCQI